MGNDPTPWEMTPSQATGGQPSRAVVALVLGREGRARIVAGVRDTATPVFCETVPETLRAAMRRAARAVILEPKDRDATPTDALVRALRRKLPAVPVLAYFPTAPPDADDILAVARAGVCGLVLRGHDAGIALRQALDHAGDRCAASIILRELGTLLPAAVQPILEHCMLHVQDGLTVAALAQALAVDRRTLVIRLSAAGMPGPQALIGWARLLHAADALVRDGRSMERVALDFGFASLNAMRNMFLRYARLQPADVRARGGLACVLPLFRRALLDEGGARRRTA